MVACPVCTVAVAGGAGLCRWLGVDDVISGVWIGGLLALLTLWLILWLDRKNIRFKLRGVFTAAVVYLSAIIPLYQLEIIGDPLNQIFGVDKLLIGIASGGIALWVGNWLYLFLKRRNNGRVYFPFQKVVIPVVCLAIASGILYLLTC